MKILKLFIFALLPILSSCFYKYTYFSPSPVTEKDYSQRSQLYIYRDHFELVAYTIESKNALTVVIHGKTYDGSIPKTITIPSTGFHISTKEKKHYPITKPYIYETKDIIEEQKISLRNNQRFAIDFNKSIIKSRSFTLHLPQFSNYDDKTINNLNEISFSKESKWLPMTIN